MPAKRMNGQPRLLVTGAAGFIGSHLVRSAIAQGYDVCGVDNLNEYYDVGLKEARLKFISEAGDFRFERTDLADHSSLMRIFDDFEPEKVVNLAAQAGVRHSIDQPFDYGRSNLIGHLSVLEAVRHSPSVEHLIYASSSSVYGNDSTLPFAEQECADKPVSLYAATKRSAELLSESYSALYGMRQTGFRFFTVYGPWGRPDMAYWKFTRAILKGEPIELYNAGNLKRDFTYIDDIIHYLMKAVESGDNSGIYNIGGADSHALRGFVETIERLCGCKADLRLADMQPGDVYETAADLTRLHAAFGKLSPTPLEQGLGVFVDWFRRYHDL